MFVSFGVRAEREGEREREEGEEGTSCSHGTVCLVIKKIVQRRNWLEKSLHKVDGRKIARGVDDGYIQRAHVRAGKKYSGIF